MTTLYLLLLIASAVCFAISMVKPDPRLIPAGLLLWVLVPLIQTVRVA